MLSLQQLTDTWGNWFAAQNGTSLHWTESTNYADHSELDDWHQYQVSATCLGIVYDSNSPPTNGSDATQEVWYDNNTAVQQDESLTYTHSSTTTYTWAITESISIGIEISATEGPPALSSTQKLSVTMALSSTQTQQATSTQSWNVVTPIKVPPNSSLKCDAAISMQTYDINFTQQVQLSGYINVWFNDSVIINGSPASHYCWFIPIEQVFQDIIANNLANTAGYQITSNGVATTASGTFSGSSGISVGVTTTQYPLRGSALPAQFKAGRKSTVYRGLKHGK